MKIAIFYHCVLSGPRIPNSDHAIAVMAHQMRALKESGLAARADEIHIGLNGRDSEELLISAFAPPGYHIHGTALGESELATLQALQNWLRPGWAVLYHHIKGVQYPHNPVWDRWRNCMERACVWNWEECVHLLESGLDTVGAHWLTPQKYAMIGKDQRYWGGNFWWARSDYLLSLPPLAPDTHANRYEAEAWIGKSPRRPRVHDFAPHWPMSCKP